jgi:hypothetical protein
MRQAKEVAESVRDWHGHDRQRVTLSGAKGLGRRRERFFAALRMT